MFPYTDHTPHLLILIKLQFSLFKQSVLILLKHPRSVVLLKTFQLTQKPVKKWILISGHILKFVICFGIRSVIKSGNCRNRNHPGNFCINWHDFHINCFRVLLQDWVKFKLTKWGQYTGQITQQLAQCSKNWRRSLKTMPAHSGFYKMYFVKPTGLLWWDDKFCWKQ